MALIVGCALPAPVLSTTYYVSTDGADSNPGTRRSPWRTLQKAVDTMAAGDATIVNAGAYGEIVNTVRSGRPGHRITIRASGKVVTKTFNIRHDYITVSGFEMTAANERHTITVTGSHCEILNNTIHDTGASWGVIRMDSATLTGCVVRGNRYYSDTGPGEDLPWIIVTGRNNVVEDNEIGPARDLDVFRIWGEGHLIRRNYIHDISTSPGSVAHMDVFQTFGFPRRADVIARNIVFEKNRIVNFDGQICMTEHNGSAAGMRDWDIRNNVFVNVPLQANIGIPNMRFYNNTFFDVGRANKLVLYGYNKLPKGESTGSRIVNNIIISSSNVVDYGGAISVDATGARVDHNYVANIDGFRPLNGFAETHGINGGDPRFIDAAGGDFGLQPGSPAIDRGATLSLVQDDFGGTARPQGRGWDIGAFEHRGSRGRNSVRVPVPPHRDSRGMAPGPQERH